MSKRPLLNPPRARRVCDYFEQLEQQDVISSVEPGDVGKLIPSESLILVRTQMLNHSLL